MSEEPPKDANDVLRAGKPLELAGEPIDPGAVVVSLDRARAARAKGPGGGAPPPIDTPPPSDDDNWGNRRGGGRDDDDRPVIVVTTEEAEVNAAATAALGRDPSLFVRGNALVRVIDANAGAVEHAIRDPDPPAIDVAPPEIIQERLAWCARFVKRTPIKDRFGVATGEHVDTPLHPPKWCVGAVRLRGEWPGFRRLEGIVEMPVLRKDGTVLDQPGYDARSGLLFRGAGAFPAVPEQPSADDVKAALAELADIVCDVDWARPAHRSSWLASALTPLARYAFEGPAPLFLFDASVPGAGKGLLVELACRIATGRSAPLSSFSPDDAEMEKRILTWASSGRSVVVLDDVSVRLDGDSMRRILTATTVSGRILGLSKDWSGPALMTWYATGNNVQIGADLFRRISHARILSPVEDPSKRTGFKYPDLKAHVAKHARQLTRAALTILRGYCVAGRPDMKLPPWGSFEGWSSLVRSAIVWAGWDDPNETVDELRKSADSRHSTHRALVLAWHRLLVKMGRQSATAKAAIDFACKGDPGPLPELKALVEEIASGKDGRPSSTRLGYVLRSIKERVFETEAGRFALADDGEDRTGTKLWRAVALDGATPSAAGDAGAAPPASAGRGAGDAGHAGDVSVPSVRDQGGIEFHSGLRDHLHHQHPQHGPSQGSFTVDPDDDDKGEW